METPDHHTLLILYVDEEEATKITATGDDKHLAHVEWGVWSLIPALTLLSKMMMIYV